MIKPLYFPNIYIKEETLESLEHFVEEVYAYSVSASCPADEAVGDKGTLKIFRPEYKDEDEFNEFILSGFNSKPLYDPDRAFALTAELQKRVDDASTEEDSSLIEKYRVMRARVFLQMAYEYDMQSSRIRQELRECKRKEEELIKELQGFEEAESLIQDCDIALKQEGDTSDFQLEKRFESWIDIFIKASEEDGKSGNGFYITDSRSLIDTIIEFEPDLKKVGAIRPETVEKEELSGLITQLTECDWKTDKAVFATASTSKDDIGTEKLVLYILPEKDPCDFFEKFASVNKSDKRLVEHREIKQNTVIGYIGI